MAEIVWVTVAVGRRRLPAYHGTPGCNSRSGSTLVPTTRDAADRAGLEPCGACMGGDGTLRRRLRQVADRCPQCGSVLLEGLN